MPPFMIERATLFRFAESRASQGGRGPPTCTLSYPCWGERACWTVAWFAVLYVGATALSSTKEPKRTVSLNYRP